MSELSRYCERILLSLSSIVNDKNGNLAIEQMRMCDYKSIEIMTDNLLEEMKKAKMDVGNLEKVRERIYKTDENKLHNLLKKFYEGTEQKKTVQDILSVVKKSTSRTTRKNKSATGGSSLPVAVMVGEEIHVNGQLYETCGICNQNLNGFIGQTVNRRGQSYGMSRNPRVLHLHGGVEHKFHENCLWSSMINGCVNCRICNKIVPFPHDYEGKVCEPQENPSRPEIVYGLFFLLFTVYYVSFPRM